MSGDSFPRLDQFTANRRNIETKLFHFTSICCSSKLMIGFLDENVYIVFNIFSLTFPTGIDEIKHLSIILVQLRFTVLRFLH
jgi:hypothetical protein